MNRCSKWHSHRLIDADQGWVATSKTHDWIQRHFWNRGAINSPLLPLHFMPGASVDSTPIFEPRDAFLNQYLLFFPFRNDWTLREIL